LLHFSKIFKIITYDAFIKIIDYVPVQTWNYFNYYFNEHLKTGIIIKILDLDTLLAIIEWLNKNNITHINTNLILNKNNFQNFAKTINTCEDFNHFINRPHFIFTNGQLMMSPYNLDLFSILQLNLDIYCDINPILHYIEKLYFN
jgi:hypothetical protein